MKTCLSLLAVGAMLIVPATAPAAGRVGGAAPAQSLTMQPPLSPWRPAAAMTPTTTRGPTSTGQPNQSCGSASAPQTPGNAASAPGSAFNPAGHAGTVYAGQQPQNSRNTASVSQYDVACSHQP